MVADLRFDAPYESGGYDLAAADFDTARISFLDIGSTAGLYFDFDYTSCKLRMCRIRGPRALPGTPAESPEVNAGTDLSVVVVRVKVTVSGSAS